METLESLRQQAHRAYSWTSMDPDKRGDSDIESYTQELNADIETITKQGATPDQVERYVTRYKQRLSHYFSSHSNCASTFITGGSNFPVRRQEKLHRWADGAYEKFREFRSKVLAAYEKQERKNKIIDQGGELEVAKKKLAELILLQETMKRVNVIYRAFKKDPTILETADLKESMKEMIRTWTPEYSYIKAPIQPYMLQNNGAKIKATEIRIAELEKKEQRSSREDKIITFEGGEVILNYSIDRVQIKHKSKPEESVRQQLRHKAFKWSPTQGVWQRQLTGNALYAAEQLTGLKLTA